LWSLSDTSSSIIGLNRKIPNINMTSQVKKLQDLEVSLKGQHGEEVSYGRALREAIIKKDRFMEVEVLKSLGDLHLQKGKLCKDSATFDKAAALYAVALLRCTDPDTGETLEHRIRYMEKLSRQLLHGYSPHFRWLSQKYWGTAESNVLRVAEICDKLDRRVGRPWHSVEDIYTEALVMAIGNSDMFLEFEVLKSLGDFYLKKGTKTSDVSQFSKAAAMYNKALTVCGDPGTKLTIEHRIGYMDKIRERVKKYRDHLKEGESSLDSADFDSAERHFAAALKMVHVRDPTVQQYQREVEPMCKLGDVYCKRGQQTAHGGDFVKAAALYNAAIARSEDQVLNGSITTAIREVDKLFLKCILDVHCVAQNNTEKHKKQLKEMRDKIKLELETIDQQLDPYVHDENDPRVKDIEAKRAQAVRQLFEGIAQQRKGFISLLVEECIGLMGPPPCKYALIGLGSQATGLVTPYSDLEFAILIEEENEKCLVYFRDLTHYLHLEVVNLGETILPALGIKSLNDFYSKDPLENWYYDSVTPRGFAFDGSMPKASKTPLGRQGTKNKPPSELICTPQNMVTTLQQDFTLYLKEGYHLATVLRNPCLIAGEKYLIDIYKTNTAKILQVNGGKMAQKLSRETLKEILERTRNKETITAMLADVKKEIYRFPALAVDCLALSSHIIPNTVWETIEEMENQQVISPINAHHLTVLTSISAELRLRTYIANGGQKENISALSSIEIIHHEQESSLQTNDGVQTSALIPVFHLQNEKQLFRYYYTAVPLKNVLQEWSKKEFFLDSFPDFYDSSTWVKGMMYLRICKFRQAISCYHEAMKKARGTDSEKRNPLNYMYIGVAYHGLGDYRKAISYFEQALQMNKSIASTARPDIVTLLNHLGLAWSELGDYRTAISYYKQALQMSKSIYGWTTGHADYGNILISLGWAWFHLGDYKKAINYYEQGLQMYRSVYGQSTPNPYIAYSFNNMGLAWQNLGDYRKAISYHEQALKMRRSIYGQNTAHHEIVMSLGNLGSAWGDLDDHRKEILYHEQALQMCRSIYSQGTAHREIAATLSNLGTAWCHLGEYRKAIWYHEQALQMYRCIYGQGTAHRYIVISLNNLGSTWGYLGDNSKEINYYEQALEMNKCIYGHGTAHPQIITLLNNLGMACCDQGYYRKAVSYYQMALEMCTRIFGQGTAHPLLADLLNNIGSAWSKLGDYRKSVNFYEQALKMHRDIYGQGKAHSHTASTLGNLGSAWGDLGDHSKAISYCEQALQMHRSIYSENTAHPDIATALSNLGGAWHNLGDHERALGFGQEALAMARHIFPQDSNHPLIKLIEKNIASFQ
ncbi:hypothetical protein Bbelb_141200, partial [Branchiostoma belcheri]